MFIHEMTNSECYDALMRAKFGRLACARNNQPYVLPFNFAFDGTYLYGFTTRGQKVEWMRSNPLVCFEVDEAENHNHWSSVIVFGEYEELPDRPEHEATRKHACACLQQRAMWWEPGYISQAHRDNPHSVTPIFFRIKIGSITGHRANADESEATVRTKQTSSVQSRPRRSSVVKAQWILILKAAIVYFAIVFGAGSIFGPVRIIFAAPRFGERMSELLEAPLMIFVIGLAANWIVKRFQLPPRSVYRLGAGLLAFSLGLIFEFGLVLKLRGLTLGEYFRTRDPITAIVYYVTLALFALMPLLVKRKLQKTPHPC